MIGRTNVPWDLGPKAVHITSQSDWSDFVANADEYKAGELVVLDTDISAGALLPISFAGNFDGGNHTITATFRADGDYGGLFRSLGPGQIVANLTLQGTFPEITQNTYAGGIAPQTQGTADNPVLIQNCHFLDVSLSGYVIGGIVGHASHTHFLYCSTVGGKLSVTSVRGGMAGGICGENVSGTIELCFATSDSKGISIFQSFAGGIAGQNTNGGAAINCWCYQSTVVGSSDQGGANTGSKQVPEGTSPSNFVNMYGFNQNCWALSDELPADFNQAVVTYHF